MLTNPYYSNCTTSYGACAGMAAASSPVQAHDEYIQTRCSFVRRLGLSLRTRPRAGSVYGYRTATCGWAKLTQEAPSEGHRHLQRRRGINDRQLGQAPDLEVERRATSTWTYSPAPTGVGKSYFADGASRSCRPARADHQAWRCFGLPRAHLFFDAHTPYRELQDTSPRPAGPAVAKADLIMSGGWTSVCCHLPARWRNASRLCGSSMTATMSRSDC